MFRTALRTQLRTPIIRTTTRSLSCTPARYTILETAKEKLSDLNQKVGKAAAAGLEKAEDVTDAVKEKSQDVKETIKEDGVEAAAKDQLGRDNVREAKKTAKGLKEDAEELTDEAASKASELKKDAEKKVDETADKYKGI